MKKRRRQPKLPRNFADPTGLERLRGSAISALKARFRHIAAEQRKLVERLPREFKNVKPEYAPKVPKSDMRGADLKPNARQYTWLVDDNLMSQTTETLRELLKDILLGGNEKETRRWFFSSYIDRAHAKGTTESLQAAKVLVPGVQELQQIDPEIIFTEPSYRRRLSLVHGRVFEEMKGLTSSMVTTMRRTLTDAMGRGVGVRDIKRMLNKNVGVDLVRAERIARTEINKAYTDAYLEESQAINDEILEDDEDEIRVMHFSALEPGVTRRTHGERHGGVFTQEEQKNWWDKNGNRINCLCTPIDIVVNKKTGKPTDPDFVENAKKEGEAFFKEFGFTKKVSK